MESDRFIRIGLVGALWLAVGFLPAQTKEPDFIPIFDGKSLVRWHISAKTGHSQANAYKTGGNWEVQDGAIVGSQDIPGNGGILITDELYGDFEVALEMRNDFGPDSGLFLRSTEDGTAWQAMIDYHVGGNLMGVYGEGLGGKPHVRNFTFLEEVTKIETNAAPVTFPMPVAQWPAFWKHGEWNELRARIVNNPPTITTWINGVKFMEWTETERRHPDRGGIALQVHGGGDFTRQFVRYRNIRVKLLDGGRPYKNLSVEDAEKLRRDPNTVVFDVRTSREFAAGFVPGAANVDFYANDFLTRVRAMTTDRSKIYLVYCASGNRSLKACEQMGSLRLLNLYNIEGGYKAWQAMKKASAE